jgi:hypothetical protein
MGATANYKWTLPTVHSDASSWGGELNSTLGAIDAVVWNIEKVELAAVQSQVKPSALTVSSNPSTSTAASLWFLNGQATAGNQNRWLISETVETESGGNAGSNLVIQSFTDAGAYLASPMEIIRATGQVGFNYSVSVQGTFSAASTVSVGGALNVSGLVNANAGANITGNVAAYGNVLGNTFNFGWPAVTDFLANVSGNLRYLQWASNWYDGWNAPGGPWIWVAAGTTIMSLDGSGNLSPNGNISATGTIAATSVQANGGQVISKALGSANANLVMQDNTGAARGYCYWAPSTNAVSLLNVATNNSFQLDGSGNCVANPGGSGNFVVTVGNGLKPGGGSWGSSSDVRIKTVTGDYTSGLEAVLQLRPVTYVYKGDYAKSGGGKQFVGLVADEAMKVLPEMVSLTKGAIDGVEVDDLKVLDTTSLVFALVNAVKELKAEIEALKAAK